MSGKIGIKIPSHNSLTPSFLDELLRTAATSRKVVDARGLRRRLPEKYHMAIISTGLSYLAYLGVIKKVHGGYKPSHIGKKIGKLLAQDHREEANLAWAELLKRHRLFQIFQKYFSRKENKQGTIEDFGLYLKAKAHANWDIPTIRSRVSRLCELFADKNLIEYQNGDLSPISLELKEPDAMDASSTMNESPMLTQTSTPTVDKPTQVSISTNSWPIRMEIKFEISDRIDPKLLEMILSFLRDMKGAEEVSKH